MNQILCLLMSIVLTFADGTEKVYDDAEVTAVEIDDDTNTVTVNTTHGTDTYKDMVLAIGTRADEPAPVANHLITEARGWHEGLYAKFSLAEGAKSYHAYVKSDDETDYHKVDGQLTRNYGTHGRVDVVGLRAGTYSLKVVPVYEDGSEGEASTVEGLKVVPYSREGFAHHGRSEGIGAYNNDGTLKANAKVVYITKENAAELQPLLTSYSKGTLASTPLCVRIIGLLKKEDMGTLGSSSEGLQVKGNSGYTPLNITIEGIGDDATLSGFGILVRNAESVELRNFGNMLCMDDAISLDTKNRHVWVHNIDIFYGQAGSDADQAKGDGTVDLKGDSQYITIASCHFFDSGKSSLCGMTSETGPNYISYHDNWFDHSDSRHPRIRTMSVHVWNNYFDGNAKYGVGTTMGSSAFVEANYFRNCKYPMLMARQGHDPEATSGSVKTTFSGEDGGFIKSFANVRTGLSASNYTTCQSNPTSFDAYEAASRLEQVPATIVTKHGGTPYNNFDTDDELMYGYQPCEAKDVPQRVTGYFGAGRLNHGDLTWTFDNATDDADYGLNTALMTALKTYTTSLKGFFGSETETPDTPDEPTDPEQPVDPSEVLLVSFGADGQPSSPTFTVTGNGSSSKGEITVDGVTYTTCLKMESSTLVTFTLAVKSRVTFYFGPSETASLKIDGEKISGTSNIYTTTLDAGTHTLTKDKSVNLFLVKIEPLDE